MSESPTADQIWIAGHRGNPIHAPENTMVSFQQALDFGVEALETDIRVSRDGLPYVFHDSDLLRITGQAGQADELTIAELGRLDAGSWKGQEYRGEPIPSLFDLAGLCRDRARLILDLKVEGTAAPIAETLARARMDPAQVTMCAWTDSQAADARRHLPGARLAFISREPLARDDHEWLAGLASRGYSDLSLRFEILDTPLVERARNHGLSVFTWTINDPARMNQAIATGVEGLITDDPERLLAARNEGTTS